MKSDAKTFGRGIVTFAALAIPLSLAAYACSSHHDVEPAGQSSSTPAHLSSAAAPSFTFMRDGDGFIASAAARSYGARFHWGTLDLQDSHGLGWSLHTTKIAGAVTKPLEASINTAGRIDVQRGLAVESFENHADGIEQTFTFAKAPNTNESLDVEVELSGPFRLSLAARPNEIVLRKAGEHSGLFPDGLIQPPIHSYRRVNARRARGDLAGSSVVHGCWLGDRKLERAEECKQHDAGNVAR